MQKQDNKSCPVIVLGVGESAIGAIRSLRRRNIPVVYSKEKVDLASWAKSDIALDEWPSKILTADELKDWLVSSGLSSAVLMPCSDNWVQSVAQLDEETAARFRRWNPDFDTVEIMTDKNRFRSVLEELELPHPRSYDLDRDSENWDIPEEVFESAFLKPHDSQRFFGQFGVKGWFVDSREDAFEKAQAAWAEGIELLIQEYVPGPPSNHYFIDGYRSKDGAVTQFLARQRLRMYPPDFGNSTSMVTVPLESVDPALRTLNALFSHTGFHGIFSAEFKVDERDGLFRIIEVNCRPWWFVDYADRCGLPVCEAAYLDVMGQPVPGQPDYKVGQLGTYPIYDWEVYRNGENRSLTELLATVTRWMRSYQPIFSWSDPMPVIVNFLTLLRGAVSRRAAAIMGTSRQ